MEGLHGLVRGYCRGSTMALAAPRAQAFAETIKQKLATYPADQRDDTVILFTAHSLPLDVVNRGDPYPLVCIPPVVWHSGLRHVGAPSRIHSHYRDGAIAGGWLDCPRGHERAREQEPIPPGLAGTCSAVPYMQPYPPCVMCHRSIPKPFSFLLSSSIRSGGLMAYSRFYYEQLRSNH
jgi:hypothetical protein